MPISRTKIGERSSIAPGDYASIRANISIPRLDGVDKVQRCPMSRSFSVDRVNRGKRGGRVLTKENEDNDHHFFTVITEVPEPSFSLSFGRDQ